MVCFPPSMLALHLVLGLFHDFHHQMSPFLLFGSGLHCSLLQFCGAVQSCILSSEMEVFVPVTLPPSYPVSFSSSPSTSGLKSFVAIPDAMFSVSGLAFTVLSILSATGSSNRFGGAAEETKLDPSDLAKLFRIKLFDKVALIRFLVSKFLSRNSDLLLGASVVESDIKPPVPALTISLVGASSWEVLIMSTGVLEDTDTESLVSARQTFSSRIELFSPFSSTARDAVLFLTVSVQEGTDPPSSITIEFCCSGIGLSLELSACWHLKANVWVFGSSNFLPFPKPLQTFSGLSTSSCASSLGDSVDAEKIHDQSTSGLSFSLPVSLRKLPPQASHNLLLPLQLLKWNDYSRGQHLYAASNLMAAQQHSILVSFIARKEDKLYPFSARESLRYSSKLTCGNDVSPSNTSALHLKFIFSSSSPLEVPPPVFLDTCASSLTRNASREAHCHDDRHEESRKWESLRVEEHVALCRLESGGGLFSMADVLDLKVDILLKIRTGLKLNLLVITLWELPLGVLLFCSSLQ
ncbi:uncharacterized protein G2W53_004932 [Senna tora]|uniref:Uncharacterized protein n=1 Tax=Senna tora TaxID=362788 RepID=A0A834XCM4_9FABA|nr:uncharacterized protein G2W53_004932 [Senna tora]